MKLDLLPLAQWTAHWGDLIASQLSGRVLDGAEDDTATRLVLERHSIV
jgi:hypothetical protein